MKHKYRIEKNRVSKHWMMWIPTGTSGFWVGIGRQYQFSDILAEFRRICQC